MCSSRDVDLAPELAKLTLLLNQLHPALFDFIDDGYPGVIQPLRLASNCFLRESIEQTSGRIVQGVRR